MIMAGGARKFIKVRCDIGLVCLNCDHIVSVECYRNRTESQPVSSIKFTMDNNKEFVSTFDVNEEYDEFVSIVLYELCLPVTGA